MNWKKTLKTVYTAVTLLAALLALSVSTYAWFTLSGAVNITPMKASVGTAEGNDLLISAAESGPFAESCELQVTQPANGLLPVSTADLSVDKPSFFVSAKQSTAGIVTSYRYDESAVENRMLHGKVYLKSENQDATIYLNEKTIEFGTNDQTLAAMRLGLKFTQGGTTKTYIFKLDNKGGAGAETQRTVAEAYAGQVISAVAADGSFTAVADPAEDLKDYYAVATEANDKTIYSAGDKSLITISADQVCTVEFWLYLEGCDDNCGNAAQKQALSLALGFAGVASDTQG